MVRLLLPLGERKGVHAAVVLMACVLAGSRPRYGILSSSMSKTSVPKGARRPR